MKVLHLTKYYPPFNGGIEAVTQDIVRFTPEIEFSILAHAHTRFSRTISNGSEAKVIRTPIVGRLLFTPLAPLYVVDLSLALNDNPDVLHLHMPNPSVFWCLFLLRARKLPWVVHWHSDVVSEDNTAGFLNPLRLFYKLYAPFEKAILRRAEKIVTTSPTYAKSSTALAPFLDKVVTIPIGIQDVVSDLRASRDNEDALKVLTVGRLTYYKGHRYLMLALQQLKEAGVDVKWTIVGRGDEKNKLQALANELQVSSCVYFADQLSDNELLREYSACDVFVLPSIERAEAFGVVLLEAMRASKPCVVTDVNGSGMSWIVRDKTTGIVVPARDEGALARALASLAQDAVERDNLGRNGRVRFLDNFTAAKAGTSWFKLYKLIGSSKRPNE